MRLHKYTVTKHKNLRDHVYMQPKSLILTCITWWQHPEQTKHLEQPERERGLTANTIRVAE